MIGLWLLVALTSWSGSVLTETPAKISIRARKPDTGVLFVVVK